MMGSLQSNRPSAHGVTTMAVVRQVVTATVVRKARVPFSAGKITGAGRRIADVDVANASVIDTVATLPSLQLGIDAMRVTHDIRSA